MSPFELFWRVPKHTIEKECVFILNLVSWPSRIPVSPLTVGTFNLDLVFGVVRNSWSSICVCLYEKSETTKWIFFAHEFISIPFIKVSEKLHAFGVWCPFFESKVSIWLEVQTVLFVTSSNFNETSFSILESLEPSIELIINQDSKNKHLLLEFFMSQFDVILVVAKILIVFDNL